MISLLVAFGVLGCGSREPDPVSDAFRMDVPEAVADQASGSAVVLPEGAVEGAPAEVRLQYDSISRLHQGYFGDPNILSVLEGGISGCVLGPTDVVISYDSENHIGRMTLYADTSGLRCRPTASAKGFDLSPLVPVTQAMAAYRDKLAAVRDFRISSFRIGVNFMKGLNLCTLWSAGQYPPDGTTWSPCVEFAGNRRCGNGVAGEGVSLLQFPDREDQLYLAKCFGY